MPQQGMPQQGMPQQGMPQQGFMPPQGLDPRMGYAAQGGRIGYDDGGPTPSMDEIARAFKLEFGYDMSLATDKVRANFIQDYTTTGTGKAQGGRIGYKGAGPVDIEKLLEGLSKEEIEELLRMMSGNAQGGRIGAQGGGIMPLLDMGGMEKDYRQDGGFVPIGRKEKADDVPARLSKNEFVFTADAVKAAGGGDIDEGAQRMYNVMKNLEAGGQISQQSQGQG